MSKKNKRENKDIYELVAANIKKYRKELGITQAELAERVELSHEFIRRIESKKGKKNFSIETIFQIAVALNIDVKQLFDFPKDKN
ncbi:MAG: helix-turn-helix transcriptional regulator [bacterium]|nr:helix-turn-helix transcriptional regulator [bacterium]